MRIVIAGGPRTGKTTFGRVLAAQTGARLRHTDDLIGRFAWSDASAEVARWFDEAGPWIVEGVAAVRAIRKWLAAHPQGAPADAILWASAPTSPRTPKQEAMGKACETIAATVLPDVEVRQVLVLRRSLAGLDVARVAADLRRFAPVAPAPPSSPAVHA